MNPFLILLCLTGLTLVACNPVSKKAEFDFRQRVVNKVQKTLPSKPMLKFDVATIKGSTGQKGHVLALIPKSTNQWLEENKVGDDVFRFVDKKMRTDVFRYHTTMSCQGTCTPKNWGAIVAKQVEAFTARGDIFTILENKALDGADSKGHIMVLERKVNAETKRMIYVWRWNPKAKAMYVCEVVLSGGLYWNHSNSLKTACLLNEPVFDQ